MLNPQTIIADVSLCIASTLIIKRCTNEGGYSASKNIRLHINTASK
ncbi:hypothetical protein [Treponema phagedenis]|nr:hypothetical protein [Treponema phagedenis]EFW36919.1 hypothetical protein HMPREF9554_02619 [Treponema phagedenis F0421]NVP23010.1 hypothetical protein [Treponema phagedenis]QKS92377.1 hypothetical protein HPJ96_07345 [Treponema phagedenis]QLC57889.1 hypothetical protein HW453_03000 [Treponema phagedenis]